MSELVKDKTKIRRIWTFSTRKASVRKEIAENVPAVTKKNPTQSDTELLGCLIPALTIRAWILGSYTPGADYSVGMSRCLSPLTVVKTWSDDLQRSCIGCTKSERNWLMAHRLNL